LSKKGKFNERGHSLRVFFFFKLSYSTTK